MFFILNTHWLLPVVLDPARVAGLGDPDGLPRWEDSVRRLHDADLLIDDAKRVTTVRNGHLLPVQQKIVLFELAGELRAMTVEEGALATVAIEQAVVHMRAPRLADVEHVSVVLELDHGVDPWLVGDHRDALQISVRVVLDALLLHASVVVDGRGGAGVHAGRPACSRRDGRSCTAPS